MEKDWFKDWFASEEYNSVYNHRDEDDAKKLIDLILSHITLNNNSLLLDAACGRGRHLNYLASLKLNVIGFDLSMQFLFQVKQKSLKVNPAIFRADIREVCFKKKFDLVLNLFTSFGYFETDEENFRFVKKTFSFLNDNGYYVLDYLNKSYLTQNLIPYSKRLIGDIVLEEFREIKNDRVIKKILIERGGKKKIFHESVKLYSKDFLLEQFISFGYSYFKLFGDYEGHPYDEIKSERLIMIFQK
ncbi:MAG: class I SAM-dependent methyltransferase [Melioribacteraceae bacterium]|jgi:SAM-dependent methyltransferase|nr:class I SAM-dependent methyltransferase [Melioribacteraceae bacterium]